MELQLEKNVNPNRAFVPRDQGFDTTAESGKEIFLNSARNRLVMVGENRYQIVAGVWTGEVIRLTPFQQRENYLQVTQVYIPRDILEFQDITDTEGKLSMKDRLIFLPLEKAYLFTAGPNVGRKMTPVSADKKLRVSPL